MLDVGCDAAEPFTGYFLAPSIEVECVDFSTSMLWPDCDLQTVLIGRELH